jgi:(S)-mandelate dehydrogenase
MVGNAAAAQNIHDLELLARKRLPRVLFDFIARGAEDEVTMRENLASIKRIALRQRVGMDVSRRNLAITLFGREQSMPIVLGVTGFSGLLAYRGEHAMAAAAREARVPFTLGTFNLASLPEVTASGLPPPWYQLYPAKDRAAFEFQVDNARAGGVEVLTVTLDSALGGNREYLRRSGFGMQSRLAPWAFVDTLLHPRWLFGTYLRSRWHGRPRLGNVPPAVADVTNPRIDISGLRLAADFTWADARSLRDRWPGRLVLKGVSTAEDAAIAVDLGADGIIVSNHGGRSLDGCVASMTALPEVVEAVKGRAAVMVDGGFVRGADVVKALALGATAVLIGRATAFGLAAAGRVGVARALAILREELDRALALVGCRHVGELSRAHVSVPRVTME